MRVQALPPPASPSGAAAASRRCWAILAALLTGAAANLWARLPWVPEAMYLGTTSAAAVLTSLRVLRQRPRRLLHLLLAALGVSLMALCLPLDPLLCAAAGPWLGTATLLFLGSDLGFAALVELAGEGGLGRGAPPKTD